MPVITPTARRCWRSMPMTATMRSVCRSAVLFRMARVPGRPAMSDRRRSPLAAGLALAALPQMISVFGPSRLGPREVEVATATLDDLAFALDRRAVLTPAERAALEALYFL